MAEENKANAKSKDEKAEERQERRRKIIRAITYIILIIIILILLFFRSCGNGPLNPDNPYDSTQGEWDIGNKRDETQDQSIVPDNITFSGKDDYTVSSGKKEIELSNPKVNQANFVFTITDSQTGEVIAKTGKVEPGQYAYINVYDYFEKSGSYEVVIEISAYSYAGQQLNGANTKAVVTVK